MKRIVVIAAALLVCCDAPAGDDRQATGPSATLAVVGQALIEHDPREYLDAPLATVVPILASADAVFTNLEVAIAGPGCNCAPTRDDIYFHGAGPEVLDYLAEIGVSMLSLANNHSWDYGPQGVVSTFEEAARRGFTYAGTGRTLQHAVAPAYREVGGLRVGLVAVATVNAPPEAAATDTGIGVNLMAPGDSAAWDLNIGAIRRAAAGQRFHHRLPALPGRRGPGLAGTLGARRHRRRRGPVHQPRRTPAGRHRGVPRRPHPLWPGQLHLPHQDGGRELSARDLGERCRHALAGPGRSARGGLYPGGA